MNVFQNEDFDDYETLIALSYTVVDTIRIKKKKKIHTPSYYKYLSFNVIYFYGKRL